MKSVEPDCGNTVRGMMAIFGHENAIKCKNNGTTGGVMFLHAFLVAIRGYCPCRMAWNRCLNNALPAKTGWWSG